MDPNEPKLEPEELPQVDSTPVWKRDRPYKDLKFCSAADFKVRIAQYTELRKHITELIRHQIILNKCLYSTRELCSQLKKYPNELSQADYEGLLKDITVISSKICEASSQYSNMIAKDKADLHSGPYASQICGPDNISYSREAILEEFVPEIRVYYREKQIL